ncbi:MAG: hypothetical protein BWK79_00095 [Beggiatoa sp. IS2]|nr:MAG: hypothetical protein BWK79_00095 [Beggiatoa sp. IS2]
MTKKTNYVNTEELRQRLRNLEAEQRRQNAVLRKLNKLENPEAPASHHTHTPGYVICLMFESQPTVEWSQAGWRPRGRGTCYETLEQAVLSLATIQNDWPDYQIKILKK